MTAESLPVRLQVGARTIASVSRRLIRVPLSLADARERRCPVLPVLDHGDDGWLVTSLPEDRLVDLAARDRLVMVRQRYQRSFVDLRAGYDSWWSGLNGRTRSAWGRKLRRLEAASGGQLAVTRSATPGEIAAFLPIARGIAATTYQTRLLGTELPSEAELLALAAANAVRGWLLAIDRRPAAFLLCGAEGDTLRYDYCGHDPATNGWSPGAVLQLAALRDLMEGDRFATFDFLEGEGQHKRQLASGSIVCCDVLVLRKTLANRILIASLRGFDGAVSRLKRSASLRRLARIVGR